MLNVRALCCGVVAATLVAAPAFAETKPAPEQRIEKEVELMLDGLRLLLERIPQYEMPEIMPNGDIVIRRRNPDQPGPGEKKPDSDEKDGVKL